MEATQFWKTIAYDLVLLADPQHADSAAWITRIRDDKPGQRIGLLVGPPKYIQEVSRLSAKVKPVQRRRVSLIAAASAKDAAASRWQEAIVILVSDLVGSASGGAPPPEAGV
jgi:hypothetical protein